jgi:hypothetical protein
MNQASTRSEAGAFRGNDSLEGRINMGGEDASVARRLGQFVKSYPEVPNRYDQSRLTKCWHLICLAFDRAANAFKKKRPA